MDHSRSSNGSPSLPYNGRRYAVPAAARRARNASADNKAETSVDTRAPMAPIKTAPMAPTDSTAQVEHAGSLKKVITTRQFIFIRASSRRSPMTSKMGFSRELSRPKALIRQHHQVTPEWPLVAISKCSETHM
ncbi:Uu.00g134310.m01.CDS01 [Anthostomella pinea]|uniref:Uu.00g134310.m01.CDS01 n=1 Tax=Anthostomella pinea TaxID=933095 RepID=A0AAI8VNY0_9PEZI|nr:Uu.00g134310.m01.CDS01 [Anthostomella pinea]